MLRTPATPAACRRFLPRAGPPHPTLLPPCPQPSRLCQLVDHYSWPCTSQFVCVRALKLDTQVFGYSGGELRDGWRLSPAQECSEGGVQRGMLWQPPTLSQTLSQSSHPHFCYYSNSLSFFCFSPPCSCPLLSPLLLFLISSLLVRCLLPFHPSLLFIFHSGAIPADMIVVNLSSIHGDGDL